VFHAAIADTTSDEISDHIVHGAALPDSGDAESLQPGETVLQVSALTAPSVQKSQPLHALNFDVRAGESLGLAGVWGNGQVELVECLAGLRAISGGTVHPGGCDITGTSALVRRHTGLAYVSADPSHEGLKPESSIRTNVIAGSHHSAPIARGGILNPAAMRRVAGESLNKLKSN